MSSRSLFATVALLSCLAVTSLAKANGLPTTGLALTVDPKGAIDVSSPQSWLYVPVSACTGKGVTLKFKVTMQPTTASSSVSIPNLEVWGGTGNDCSDPKNRQLTTAGGMTNCWLVWQSSGAVTTNITLDASFLTGKAFGNHKDECTKVTNGTYDLYFLPLQTKQGENTTSAPALVTGVKTLQATFTLYTNLPDAPSGLSGRDGEGEIGASWKAVNTGKQTEYILYFDKGTTGMADEDGELVPCGGGKLVKDMPPPPEGATIFKSTSKTTSGSLTGLDGKGIHIGDKVAVAVASKDIAGNVSWLQDPVCVERVSTETFWDACKGDKNCKNDFDKCSAQPGSTAHGAFTALALAACMLALGRRRRTSGRNV
jgi:hypothetical protein